VATGCDPLPAQSRSLEHLPMVPVNTAGKHVVSVLRGPARTNADPVALPYPQSDFPAKALIRGLICDGERPRRTGHGISARTKPRSSRTGPDPPEPAVLRGDAAAGCSPGVRASRSRGQRRFVDTGRRSDYVPLACLPFGVTSPPARNGPAPWPIASRTKDNPWTETGYGSTAGASGAVSRPWPGSGPPPAAACRGSP
jgi:hypothetical protein